MSFREGLDDQGTYYHFNEVAGTTPIVLIHGVGLSLEIWNPKVIFLKIIQQLYTTYMVMEEPRARMTLPSINFPIKLMASCNT